MTRFELWNGCSGVLGGSELEVGKGELETS